MTDLEELLQVFGKIRRAVYIPYGQTPDPQTLATALATHLPQPARIFSVESDVLTPEEGKNLVQALVGTPSVLLFGPSESELIQRLGDYWSDYCEHSAHWHGSIVRHVTLSPSKAPYRIACLYLLIPVAEG